MTDSRMWDVILFLVLDIYVCFARILPGCVLNDNAGVLDEFGPLPGELLKSNQYCQVFRLGQTIITVQLKEYPYTLEYYEFNEHFGMGSDVLAYFKLYYNENGKTWFLDNIRVDPKKWGEVESAILDIDSHPTPDNKLRVTFMTSECDCIIRVYDLNAVDIPRSASTITCGGFTITNKPHMAQRGKQSLSAAEKQFQMSYQKKFSWCKEDNNYGVISEFGDLPLEVHGGNYYHVPITGVAEGVLSLTNELSMLKVEYVEFKEKRNVGPETFIYLKLNCVAGNDNLKMLDYLRVDPDKWKQIQNAILAVNMPDSTNKKLRVKYLTSECKCVMRVYDLSLNDIMINASTMSCDGSLLTNNPHKLPGAVTRFTDLPKITNFGAYDKYPGCDENNYGILDDFGPLPSSLLDRDLYYDVLSTCYSYNSFLLSNNLDKYKVVYSEFREQYGVGSGLFAYHTLYYNYGGELKLLDYLRVNPKHWRQVQVAILKADTTASKDKILRVWYLLSDCTCVMRNYDLNAVDISGQATTTACSGAALPDRPKSVALQVKKKVTVKPEVGVFGPGDKYPGCDENDNFGVIDEFSAPPAKLRNVKLFYEVPTAAYSFTKFRLNGNMDKYKVEYSEFREQSYAGSSIYGYHTIYFNFNGKYKVLDYLQIRPKMWKQIQNSILKADRYPDAHKLLRIRYLMSDCSCVMRVYDLSLEPASKSAQTLACNGSALAAKPQGMLWRVGSKITSLPSTGKRVLGSWFNRGKTE